MKIGRVVPKIWSRTNKHTQRQTDAHITILCSAVGCGVISKTEWRQLLRTWLVGCCGSLRVAGRAVDRWPRGTASRQCSTSRRGPQCPPATSLHAQLARTGRSPGTATIYTTTTLAPSPHGTHGTCPYQLWRLWGQVYLVTSNFCNYFVIFRSALWEAIFKGETERKVEK